MAPSLQAPLVHSAKPATRQEATFKSVTARQTAALRGSKGIGTRMPSFPGWTSVTSLATVFPSCAQPWTVAAPLACLSHYVPMKPAAIARREAAPMKTGRALSPWATLTRYWSMDPLHHSSRARWASCIRTHTIAMTGMRRCGRVPSVSRIRSMGAPRARESLGRRLMRMVIKSIVGSIYISMVSMRARSHR